jgi:hypothetical protein
LFVSVIILFLKIKFIFFEEGQTPFKVILNCIFFGQAQYAGFIDSVALLMLQLHLSNLDILPFGCFAIRWSG